MAVFRWVSLGYAAVAAGVRLDDADRPVLGLGLLVVMITWSAALTLAVPRASRARRHRLLQGLAFADVVICAALVVGAEVVGPRTSHALPMMWATSGVFGAALVWGAAGGVASGLLLSVMFILEWDRVTDALVGTSMLLLVSGAVAGHLSRTALRAEAALADALAARAADAERERLARQVHDGVLQVLALIARETPRGMPAAAVSRLAAEQESALRDLLRTPGPGAPTGHPPDAADGPGMSGEPAAARTDLAEALLALAHRPTAATTSTPKLTATSAPTSDAVATPAGASMSAPAVDAMSAPAGGPVRDGEPALGGEPARGDGAVRDRADAGSGEGGATDAVPRLVVTVATPGVPVLLAADRAFEVVAAVGAALDNVAWHAGPGASAWVLLEDDGDEVVVTVRDDGVGLAPGWAEQAEAEGRLGLAVSIRGRVRELGGEVAVFSRPGQGTEVELRVPR